MTPKEAETAETLEKQLKHMLYCQPPVLVGCVRQNVWTGMDWAKSWRVMRGNSILHLIATREEITTPVDSFCIYYGPSFPNNKIDLYHFRGGKRKGWWEMDLDLTAALVETYSNFRVSGSTLVNEVDGELVTLYFEYTDTVAAKSEELANGALQNYHPNNPKRINKSSGRAAVSCKWCPVKSACDSFDLTEGGTEDWPRGYSVGSVGKGD